MRPRILLVLLGLVFVGGPGAAQNSTPSAPAPPPEAPRRAPDQPAQAIDLRTALRLATTSNLDIAQARAVLDQAQAARQRAVSRTLPNVSTGATYIDHAGRIQQANGNILNVNRSSLAVGITPSLSLDLADAVFLPLAARQAELATRAASVRVTNDTLLAIADAYIAVLRAHRRLERLDLTLSFLTAEQPAPRRGNSKGLLPLVKDVVEAGGKDALRSDLARLQVEVARRNEERAGIVQELRVASAELARLLRIDPRITFGPLEDRWAAVPMPGADWVAQERDFLIDFALQNRPELTESRALVQLSVAREKGARYRPYLPQFQVSYFDGGFGGGSLRDPRSKITQDLNGPIDRPIGSTGDIGRFGHRSDLGVTVAWQLQGLGFGNRAEMREAQALHNQAQIRAIAAQERVAAQVVQTHASLLQTTERLWITWGAVSDKDGKPNGAVFESVRLNFERIRGGEGRPLEALDSIRGLNDVLEAYANSLSEYDRTRFRLLVVLGLPAAGLYDPACMPACPPRADAAPKQVGP
ncbi:MAG TPA: TolC family protein [Gemmata sp.]